MMLSSIDARLFARYVGDREIRHIVRAHPFVLLERILPWVLFGVVAIQFFYAYDSFGIRSLMSPLFVELWSIMVYLWILWMIFLWYVHIWIITPKEVVILDFNGISFDEQYLSHESIVSVSSTNDRWYDPLIRRGVIRIHTKDSNLDPIYSDIWDPDAAAEATRSLLSDDPHSAHTGPAGVHTLQPKTHTPEHPMSDQEAFSLLLRTLTDVVKERTHPMEPTPEYRVGDDKPRHKHFVDTALSRVDTVDLRPKHRDDHEDDELQHMHGGDPPEGHHHAH